MGRGGEVPGGATVNSFTDHRVAVNLRVGGVAAQAPMTVQRCDNLRTAFPGFDRLMSSLGAEIADAPA
ncbi:MAG: hypothetical protein HQL51_16120 [Magnetococcales bacterium]|nr:hypothetical protein [Magnetococcales bacterium]